jgi:hypothetical protein
MDITFLFRPRVQPEGLGISARRFSVGTRPQGAVVRIIGSRPQGAVVRIIGSRPQGAVVGIIR